MTVTLGWGALAGLLALLALAFWLGRMTAGGGRGDLSGPPPSLARPAAPVGRDPEGMAPENIAPIRNALAAGDKIGAIKLMREATGLGLAEAKDAVEAMQGLK